jgi:hypothetical protein
LHRLSWELRSRIDTLVPHARQCGWTRCATCSAGRVAEVKARGEQTGLSPEAHATINDSLRQLAAVLENAHN